MGLGRREEGGRLTPDSNEAGREGKWGRLRQRLIPLLMLLVVIAISVVLFCYGRDPATISRLKQYGYLGAFLVSLIGNASILLPGIVLPILSGLGVVFHQAMGISGPIVIGLVGAAGAAIGEVVGYLAGYSGRGLAERSRRYQRLVGWVQRWGDLAIFLFALVPLFFDLVGLAAGILRFPLWRFILICWVARTLLYVGFVTAVALGWQAALPYFG